MVKIWLYKDSKLIAVKNITIKIIVNQYEVKKNR